MPWPHFVVTTRARKFNFARTGGHDGATLEFIGVDAVESRIELTRINMRLQRTQHIKNADWCFWTYGFPCANIIYNFWSRWPKMGWWNGLKCDEITLDEMVLWRNGRHPQKLLHYLLLISCEKELCDGLDLNHFANIWLKMKLRRIQFWFFMSEKITGVFSIIAVFMLDLICNRD